MKLQRYERQREVPGGPNTPRLGGQMPLTDPANQGLRQVSSAFAGASDLANARFEQRQKERRTMGAADAVSQLRQFEAEKIMPMYMLTGKDAVGDINDPEKSPGVYKLGRKLYDDEIERIAGGIKDPQTAAFFKVKALSVRDDAAESLARHEATEHQVLKQNTYNATYAQLVQSVSVHWAQSDVLENAITEIKALADDTFPGLDMTGTKLKAEAALRATAIKRMADVSPETALNHLRAWKDKLGDVYDQLSKPIESEALFDRVRLEHQGDFDAMDDAAQASAFGQDVKNAVSSWIRAAESEKKRRDDEALKQRRIDGYNSFWANMRQGNHVQAVKVAGALNSDDFTEGEKYQLEQYARQGAVKNNDLLEKSLHIQIKTGKLKDMQSLYGMPEVLQLDVEALRRLENTLENESKLPSGYNTAISALETRFDRVFKDTEYYSLKPLFLSELLTDVEREEQAKKRHLTTQELITVGNQLLDLKTEEVPLWWDKKYRNFETRADAYRENGAQKKPAAGESVTSAWVDQIPPDIRKGIIESLQQAGRPVYVDDVWKMFQHYHADESRRIMESKPQ